MFSILNCKLNIEDMVIKNIKVLQLKDEEEIRRTYSFMSLDFLSRYGLSVSLDNYKVVYDEQIVVPEDEGVYDTLENVYMRFQGGKPENYHGHSVSVSDIVSVDGVNYYCDSIGFSKL